MTPRGRGTLKLQINHFPGQIARMGWKCPIGRPERYAAREAAREL